MGLTDQGAFDAMLKSMGAATPAHVSTAWYATSPSGSLTTTPVGRQHLYDLLSRYVTPKVLAAPVEGSTEFIAIPASPSQAGDPDFPVATDTLRLGLPRGVVTLFWKSDIDRFAGGAPPGDQIVFFQVPLASYPEWKTKSSIIDGVETAFAASQVEVA
jgi:hypothetical protein